MLDDRYEKQSLLSCDIEAILLIENDCAEESADIEEFCLMASSLAKLHADTSRGMPMRIRKRMNCIMVGNDS